MSSATDGLNRNQYWSFYLTKGIDKEKELIRQYKMTFGDPAILALESSLPWR